jgi:hypothetical protein
VPQPQHGTQANSSTMRVAQMSDASLEEDDDDDDDMMAQ